MNVKQIYQLQQGTKVHHQHYGLCTIDGVIRSYGPLLLPDTKIGQTLLSQASRTPLGTPVVEPLFHLLTQVSLLTSVLPTDIPNPLTGTMPRF
jgi:hypothetical protein